MSRLRNLSRPGWVTLGLVLGAILVPATAVAVTATAVNIVGNNHTASVSPAGQLRSIEMDPSSWFHVAGLANNGDCYDLGTVSTTRGIIVKHVNMHTTALSGTLHLARLYTGSLCLGSAVGEASFSDIGVQSLPLGQGVALPAGTHLSLGSTNAQTTVDVYGYTVTKSAVPAGAAALRRAGPPAERLSPTPRGPSRR